ncbi:MAG: purine-nucleoside phosphorylase [Bacilli bacterium]|nr:purine-nucleoside phosphorylase [Bacilli bacterium]
MPTTHIEAEQSDIAKIVLMPGDPLRAKYIADKFLKDVRIVNKVRNMYAYTGYYQDKKVTIFPSGMGIPSIGIYAYELYHFYGVEEIIRIGTSGSNNQELNLLDIVVASASYSLSNYPKLFDGDEIHLIDADKNLNQRIKAAAIRNNINIKEGNIITSDIFDPYIDFDKYIKNYPENKEFLAMEMEAFGLFYLAKKLNKKAGCLLTIVDIIGKEKKESISSEDREKSLDQMIKVALESIQS